MQEPLLRRELRRFGDTGHWTPLGWLGYLCVLWMVGVLLIGLTAEAVNAFIPSAHGAYAVHYLIR